MDSLTSFSTHPMPIRPNARLAYCTVSLSFSRVRVVLSYIRVDLWCGVTWSLFIIIKQNYYSSAYLLATILFMEGYRICLLVELIRFN
jgi:hypothetical protein